MNARILRSLFAIISLFLLVPYLASGQTQLAADSVPSIQGWRKLTTGSTANFYHLSVVGRDTVYASGDDILRTTDGGLTWYHLPKSPVGFPVSGWAVQFWDSKTGWAGLGDSVYRTDDGGESWRAYGANSVRLNDVLFKTKNVGWTREDNRLTRTSDGGLTWSDRQYMGADVGCVSFADTLFGIGMGKPIEWFNGLPEAPVCGRTSDGGATWTYAYPWGQIGYVKSLVMLSRDTVVAAGEGFIKMSVDSGNHWRDSQVIDAANPDFIAMTFPTCYSGTAVGWPGLIYHTSDRGLTWVRQNSGDLGILWSVAFADSLVGYVGGENGTILKTSNGGLAWVNVSPGHSSGLLVRVTPQPASNTATISYVLPRNERVWLSLFDAAGKRVREIQNGLPLSRGNQEVGVLTRDLPSGVYTFDLVTDGEYASGKVLVIH